MGTIQLVAPQTSLPPTRQTAMPPTSLIIHSDPDILGGTPVFIGTRVPMKNLIDYLEAGDSLDEFLDHFPSVSRESAIAALELAKQMLTAYANPA
jgi:uncharacterized protein (DUF433 family)